MYWRVCSTAGEPAGRGPNETNCRRCSQARFESKRGAAAVACSSTIARARTGLSTLLPFVLRHVVADWIAREDLTRARDLLIGVGQHLLPLGEPADDARDGEEDREHLHGEPHRLVDQAGVEVDVRIELALD